MILNEKIRFERREDFWIQNYYSELVSLLSTDEWTVFKFGFVFGLEIPTQKISFELQNVSWSSVVDVSCKMSLEYEVIVRIQKNNRHNNAITFAINTFQ